MKEAFKPIALITCFMTGVGITITGVFLHDALDIVSGVLFLILSWLVFRSMNNVS